VAEDKDPDIDKVRERLLGHVPDGIPPQEATDLLREVREFVVEEDTWELIPVLEYESYLVLGSYDEESSEKERLEKISEVLGTPEGTHAFLLEEVELKEDRPELSRYKFKLVGDYSDHLVGVFEREYGGETHELTLMSEEYLEKSRVFVRESDLDGDKIEYGWMTEGFFYDFEKTGRLRYWDDVKELIEAVYEEYLEG
jgi:hypothetical protein